MLLKFYVLYFYEDVRKQPYSIFNSFYFVAHFLISLCEIQFQKEYQNQKLLSSFFFTCVRQQSKVD